VEEDIRGIPTQLREKNSEIERGNDAKAAGALAPDAPKNILLTVDVEDWFQVENLRPWISLGTWDSRELRVERNVHALLNLFDTMKLGTPISELGGRNCGSLEGNTGGLRALTGSFPPPAIGLRPFGVKNERCTFFTLGWLAERLPHMVREIAARGHEVACHGYNHQMCNRLSEADLRNELSGSKRLLEDITGAEIAGFRAPNFSINQRVLGAIRECGYRYDSSYNSFSLNGRYGKIALHGNPQAGIAYQLDDHFHELPVSNLPVLYHSGNLGNRNYTHFHLPWSGGAYFRLMPLSIFKRGVRFILNRRGAYAFYMHPWEIDPGQPKVHQASFGPRFKHYTNLWKTENKLKEMIESFSDCRFISCRQYIEEKVGSGQDLQKGQPFLERSRFPAENGMPPDLTA
jgi:polysaccharide deacetylase family protein (PEP-CTERM system associated)